MVGIHWVHYLGGLVVARMESDTMLIPFVIAPIHEQDRRL